jgi:Acetokinase family
MHRLRFRNRRGGTSCRPSRPKALKIVSCHLVGAQSRQFTKAAAPIPQWVSPPSLDAEGIDRVLNQKIRTAWGFGLSSDMRDILSAMQQGQERAKLAFDIYVHRLQIAIGGMAAVLSGMDASRVYWWTGRTPPRCEPQRAVDWDFLASTLINGQTHDPLSIRLSPLRTRACVFW